MRRVLTRLAAVCTSLIAAGSFAHAASPGLAACGDAVVTAVQARYGDVRDIAADFVQTSYTVGFGGGRAPAVSSGRVVLQVPGKMRWSYEKPEQSLVVSDGETLWLYDQSFGEAQKLPVTDSGYLSGAAIQFLLGKGDLRADFEILPIACDATQAELKLTPRAEATYEYLTLWVDPAAGLIQRTEIRDLLGNRTRVEFHGMQINQNPPSSVFRFEPPEGVAVVELAP